MEKECSFVFFVAFEGEFCGISLKWIKETNMAIIITADVGLHCALQITQS